MLFGFRNILNRKQPVYPVVKRCHESDPLSSQEGSPHTCFAYFQDTSSGNGTHVRFRLSRVLLGSERLRQSDADSVSMGAATLGDFVTSKQNVADLRRSFRRLPRYIRRPRPIICLRYPGAMAGRDPNSRQRGIAIRFLLTLMTDFPLCI